MTLSLTPWDPETMTVAFWYSLPQGEQRGFLGGIAEVFAGLGVRCRTALSNGVAREAITTRYLTGAIRGDDAILEAYIQVAEEHGCHFHHMGVCGQVALQEPRKPRHTTGGFQRLQPDSRRPTGPCDEGREASGTRMPEEEVR